MPLTLHEATVSDIPTIVNLHFASFVQSNAIQRLIYPIGLTPSVFAATLESRKSSFDDPYTHYLKVIDSEIEGESASIGREGRMVAFARYYLWREDREAGTWDAPFFIEEGELGPPGEVNLEAARMYYGRQKAMTRSIVRGRKCVYFSILTTDPTHQHRGAGTMLARWVLDLAEKEGLDVYLQATSSGYSLYHKLGFEDVDAFEVDLGALGGSVERDTVGFYRMVFMRFKIEGKDG